jgi:hypothetical protein
MNSNTSDTYSNLLTQEFFFSCIDVLEYEDKEIFKSSFEMDLPFKLEEGMLLAGGSVTNRMVGIVKDGNDIYNIIDYDIFIYANHERVYESFIANNPGLKLLFHTNDYAEYHTEGNCVIQIILKRYESIEKILYSFDLYASQNGYTDGFLYQTYGNLHAHKYSVNLFDHKIASVFTPKRIRKYCVHKGFAIISLFGKIVRDNLYKGYTGHYDGGDIESSTASIDKMNIRYLLGISKSFCSRDGAPSISPYFSTQNALSCVSKSKLFKNKGDLQVIDAIKKAINKSKCYKPKIEFKDTKPFKLHKGSYLNFYQSYYPLWTQANHYLMNKDYDEKGILLYMLLGFDITTLVLKKISLLCQYEYLNENILVRDDCGYDSDDNCISLTNYNYCTQNPVDWGRHGRDYIDDQVYSDEDHW